MKRIRLIIPVVLLILVSLACQYMPALPAAETPDVPGAPTQTAEPTTIPELIISTSLQEQEQALTALYEHVTPGVVAIQVLTETGSSLGTGLVFDSLGHIVTNQHVVEGQ